MKKKKIILPVLIVLAVAAYGIVKGVYPDRDVKKDPDWDCAEDSDRDVLEETSPFSGYEQILNALEDSIIPEPDMSGDMTVDSTGDLTGDAGVDASGVLQPDLDELISNWILENTSIEAVSEDGNGCVVKVSYPDVASLVEELSSGAEASYEGQDAESIFYQAGAENQQLQRQILERLQNGEVRRVEETIRAEIDEKSHELIWNEDLMNAMSGGLYRLLLQSVE